MAILLYFGQNRSNILQKNFINMKLHLEHREESKEKLTIISF